MLDRIPAPRREAASTVNVGKPSRYSFFVPPELLDKPVLGPPPSAPPTTAKAAIKSRVLARSIGVVTEPTLLDGRYRLVQEIGRGGLGTVWEAVLEPLGHPVAIKFLRSSTMLRDSQARARMLREARALASIVHEHIVRVDGVGTDLEGTPFIVMELLTGRPLSDVIAARGPLPVDLVIEIGQQLCDALAEAHRHGIVHRDVKPANIFVVQEEPQAWHCKLIDFGLCKPLEPVSVEGMTTSGMIIGTPGYMAPEQACGDRVDTRADLYGLACVLFEALTGQPAFAGPRTAVTLSAQLRGRPWASEVAAGHLSQSWADLFERSLDVSPDARPPDAEAMAEAIRRAASLDRPMPRRRARVRRWALPALGAVTLFTAAALAPTTAPFAGLVAAPPHHRPTWSALAVPARDPSGDTSSAPTPSARATKSEFSAPARRQTKRTTTPRVEAKASVPSSTNPSDARPEPLPLASDRPSDEPSSESLPSTSDRRVRGSRPALAPGIRDPFLLIPGDQSPAPDPSERRPGEAG